MKEKKIEDIYNYALKLLKYRNRSENELKEKLSKFTVDEQIINEIIKKLKSFNLINDEKFITTYISQQIKKCKNIKLIIEELKNKFKIENEVLNNVNIEHFKNQLIENVIFVIKKRYPDLNFNKIQNFLLSKGFDYDEINEIISLIKDKKNDNYR